MKKTKIDWCDSTINCVYGCPNNCDYCYGNVMNKRFHFCKYWKVPEWKPDHLKDFYSKKPKSIFIDSMSDIGTWKQEWLAEVLKAIAQNTQHKYIALTKTSLDNLLRKISDYNYLFSKGNSKGLLFIGKSVTTQAQVDNMLGNNDLAHFLSIEPILEPLDLTDFLNYCHECKTLIIGAETGNRKGKVIPQKEWIESLVEQADKHNCAVFMKESLRKIMGDDFRQDKLPWEIEKMTNREYLNSLPNDKFTDLVLAKEAEFHEKNFNPELDIFDITIGTKLDFEEWLEQEHKETTNTPIPIKNATKGKKKRKYFRKCGVCGKRYEQSEMIRDNGSPNGWICNDCYDENHEHEEILDSIEEW